MGELCIVITEEDEIKIKDDSADYLKNITQEDTEYYGFTRGSISIFL